MTRLEALLERAKALSPEDQDALADDVEFWLDFPTLREGEPDGSDEELARRVAAWRANPVGIPATEVHARLKARQEHK